MFGTFQEEHLLKMKEGIELYNAQKYWECHEALEDVWMEDANDPARNVYWAVIQVASSLIHYRDGKIVGAIGLLTKAREKFVRCETLKVETPLLYNYLDWQKFKEITFKIPKEPELSDFQDLFHFRFTSYPFQGLVK
ncbi:MAG: DUF309 domain-containing protein [Bacteriovoracaceae bacterium]